MARPQRPVREKRGLYVAVRNNDVSRALRKLKRLLQDEGMILEMRKRKYYVKPSEKRAKAKAAGRARWLKKQRELELR
jgi:small subunit ribosomal protein S21